MLFDHEFPEATTLVRIVVLTKKKGQPPILWEGSPSTNTATAIRQISRNKRLVEWLHQSGYVRRRLATVDLQVQGYAGRKRIVAQTLPGYSFIVRSRRRVANVSDEVVLRSFDLVERILELMVQLVGSRDAMIGRVAEVGIRSLDVPAATTPSTPSVSDTMTQMLEEIPRLAELTKSFRKSRGMDSDPG